MTVSGAVLAPAGNTPATYININTDSSRLVGGGTVLSYLKQNAGDVLTWTPYPEFDGVVKVLAADNTVLKTISVQADLGVPGCAVSDLTVVALANGGFVLGWADYTDADNWGNSLQAHYALYDDSGNLQTTGLLSSTSGNNVRIASLASGGFATVFLASGAAHSQQGVVNTFLYNAGSGTYVKQAESYVGDPVNNAPGAGADVTKLFMLGEADITALSDGGFVVSAPTYDWVSPTYTPLGDFIFNYSPTGAQENFASGNYWQRVNWNPGQINDVAQVTAFSGGFASLNRGTNGQWQATLYHDDGSLITTNQLSDQVYHSGATDTRTYYANNLAPVVIPALDGAMNGFNLDDFVTLVDNGSDLLAVLPNAGGGFDFAHISKTTGALVSLVNSGIAVPSGATLANPRLLHEGSGFDVTYDVLTQSGAYTVASTYQYGLTAPPVNAAPTVAGIAGDATDFIVGTPQYVDGGNDYADVYDPDSASFDGGYLNVHQTSGGANGSFSFDLTVGTTQILWGSGAQPDTTNDGTTYTWAHAPAVGDKVWYGTGLSTDPADWTLVGTVVADGQGGHDLKIAFSTTEATIPAGAGISDSYPSLLLKYLMYTAPTLGARGFAVTVNDGDGATSTPVGLTMTGTSDQTSTITAAATVAEPVRLPVSADSAGAAVAVFDFTITDAGGDGLATRVAALSLDASGTGDFSKVTWLLTGPGIGSAVTGAYNASTHKIEFASVGIVVAEGAAAEYTVKAYFANPADAVRGATYALSIDGDTSVTLATGLSSQMAGAQAPVTNGSGSIVVAGPSVLAVEHTTPAHSPTNADSLTWTVRFGEAVQHLDATDFDVAGLTGETIVVAAAGTDAFTVTVSGGALGGLDGTVTLGLAAGQDVINADGQALAGLSPTGTDERAWVVDNTAPAAPGQPDLQNASDSGSSQTDDRTNVTAPTFTGSAEAGATVTLYDADGTVLGTDVATGGAWTIHSIGLAPGAHTVSARAVDAAGNESAASATTTVVVDTSVAAPGLAAITDTGASATDGITKDGTVGVTLAADVAGWEYSVDGGAHWTTGSGTSFTLPEGSYGIGTVQVRQTDTAGNTSTAASNAQAINVDTTLAAPAFALSSDTGASATDGITQDGTVAVTLAGDAAGWEYSVDGGAHWTAGSGTSFTLGEGSHAIGTVQVRQTDTAGNVNMATNAAALTVATSVAAPGLSLTSDTGASATDGVTKDGTVGVTLAPTVAGWEYSVDGGAHWTTGNGTSFTLAEGSYAIGTVQVRQADLAGNTSTTGSNTQALKVDTTVAAPTLALSSDTGSSAADGITKDGTVGVTLATDVAGWEYSVDGGAHWTTGSGTSFTLGEGDHAIGAVQVRQTDTAGNTSTAASNTQAIEVDTALAAPAFALASDTGASATDGITKIGTVAVTLAGDVAGWEYSVDGGARWTTGSGTSFTLGEGSHAIGTVQVRQTDTAGNVNTATNAAALTVATAVAAPGLSLSSDTGASATDGISKDGTVGVTLAGTVAGWEYSTDGGTHWTAGSGTTFTLAEGSYGIGAVQVRQTDLPGNTSTAASNTQAIKVDTALAAPAFALTSDTGTSATDGITQDGTVAVTLAGDAAGWEYSVDGGAHWTAGSGTSFTLGEGSHAIGTVQVRQTDTAGNVNTATNAAALTVATSVAAPGLSLSTDTGASATDGITKDGTVGVTLAGDAVGWEYSVDGGAHWTTGSGTSFALADGSYAIGTVQVRQADLAGNTSAAGSNTQAIKVDTTVAAPTFALSSDTGASATDGITKDGTVGVMLASDVAGWEYSVDGGAHWTAGSGTSFTLGEGDHATGTVQVRQTDLAGNTSTAASNTQAINVDTALAAPAFALSSDTGASATDGITKNGTVAVTLAGDAAGWEYSVDGGAHWTAGSGTSFTLGEGSHAIGAVQVRQTDTAGNVNTATNAAAITVATSVAAPGLSLTSDTGASATDGITKNGTVAVSLAGDVAGWEYSVDGGAHWSAGSGTSFTLGEGSHAIGTVQVRQTDTAGNTSTAGSNTQAIKVDTALAAPTFALSSDTGTSATDGITKDGSVGVTLAADVAGWEYSVDGGAHWTAGAGTSFTLGEGSHAIGTVQVRQTDTAGNVNTATNTAAFTVATSVAVPGLSLSSDTGASATDGVTKTSTVGVTLTGNAASWEYSVDGGTHWTAGSGTSFTLAEGSYAIGTVQVRQADVAGNTSAAGSNTQAIRVDTTVAAPTFALSTDTGTSAADGITKDGTVGVTLAADVAGWEYSVDGGAHWTAGSGTSFTLGEGSHAIGTVQVRQTDTAGNTSTTASNTQAIKVDTTLAAPTFALASDTGASATDGMTKAGAVNVTLAGDTAGWEYSVDGGAHWTTGSGTGFTLAEGSHDAGAVQVRQTDVAGNLGAAAGNTAAIVVDNVVPVVQTIVRPALTGPAGTTPFTVDVHYADGGAGLDPASIDVGDLSVTGPGATGSLAVTNVSFDAAHGVATYTVAAPSGGWSGANAGTYAIAFAAGGVLDLAGNGLAGGAGQQFEVSFNALPHITSNGGGTSAAIEIAERSQAVTTVHATDADVGDTLGYSITGGADAALFQIDAATGALSLRNAPRVQTPLDSDGNNVYLVNVGASDGHGGLATQALAVKVLADADGDGTPDLNDDDLDGDGRLNSAEDPVPSATGGGIGDGNGDGIADSGQVNVASLATVGSVASALRFATIEVAPGLTLGGVANSTVSGLPRNAKMPLGQFDFEIKGVAVGGSVDIAIYVDKSLGANGYYKQVGSTWTNLATTSTFGTKTKISFTLTDGGAYDADGVANGVIVDPGGPVVIAPRIVSAGGDVDAAIKVVENQLAVTTVAAEAVGAVTYSISGGADRDLFKVDPVSGKLAWIAAPDYEHPVDVGAGAANNTYVVEVTASDSAGSDTQVLTVQVLDADETPAPVDDGDAIPPQVEQQVPSLPSAGGTVVAGDGNGDGIADNAQSNVTSLPFLHTDHAQSNPGGAPQVYLTLVADSVDGKAVPAQGGATALTDVRQLDAPANAPADLKMPLGLISFNAAVPQAGAARSFSIYVDGGVEVNGYWKQDARGDWVNLADAAHGGKVVSEAGHTRLDFTIVDGGEFDDDGKADGVITDPGAPGWRDLATGDADHDQFPDALEATHGLQVGVKDNDVFASNKLFVMELYRDLMFREASAPEWTFWQGLLDGGAMSKVQLVSTFLDAAEFQGGAGAVTRMMYAALDRVPDQAGLAYWTHQVSAGVSLSAVAGAIVGDVEFSGKYGQLDDAAFVRQLYQNVLDRPADQAGLDFWTGQLGAHASRGDVLLGFAQSHEYQAGMDAEVTATLGYLGLLGRDAAPAEVAHWVGKLDAGVPETAVIGTFIGAPEYHDRFLP
jgi:hypothetical protein